MAYRGLSFGSLDWYCDATDVEVYWGNVITTDVSRKLPDDDPSDRNM
jgi:hypothetical protein